MGAKAKATQIKCKVCNVIDGKNRLLVAKLNYLWKHVRHRKATIDLLMW
jgi:hypothetical protein